MFHELAINCRNFSFSKKGRSNCAGRRISIRKGGDAMGPLAGAVAFPAYDANGNITEYAGDGGEILSHCDYSAFGRELINAGSDDFTYRFSTKPLCRKTGMLEYQLRKYNPWCGRWINRDAIEEDGGLNLYGYVGNNSKTMYDKNGSIGVSGLILSGITSATIVALALKAADCYNKTIGSAGDYGNRDGYAHCVVACNFNNCMEDDAGKIGRMSSSIITMIGAVGWEVVSGWGRDARNDINSGLNGIAGSIAGQSCEDACKCEGSNMP